MTLRTGHGNGAGVPRIEVSPADELPRGVRGIMPEEAPGDRGPGGRSAPGNTGLSKAGGVAKRHKTRLAEPKTTQTKTAHQLRVLAVKAGCDPRTIRSYLEGRNVHCTTRARIEEALRTALVISLYHYAVPPAPRGSAGRALSRARNNNAPDDQSGASVPQSLIHERSP